MVKMEGRWKNFVPYWEAPSANFWQVDFGWYGGSVW